MKYMRYIFADEQTDGQVEVMIMLSQLLDVVVVVAGAKIGKSLK